MIKNQLLLVGIVGIVVVAVVVIAGLGGNNQNSKPDESGVNSVPPTAESLQGILLKAETIDSLYYEITMTMTMPQYGTQTVTMKVWQEKPYLKEQITAAVNGMTNTISVIQRPEGTYLYDATQGKYVLTTTVPSYVTSLQYLDSKMIKDLLNNQTITHFATDVIDGKTATVFDYTISTMGMNMTVKMWIWNEKGLPLKALITMEMQQQTINMDIRFNNYSFADIPDSTFSVT